jgi:hypothetical protein
MGSPGGAACAACAACNGSGKRFVSRGERSKIIELALGRIFGMMQRPFMEGDFEEYECCRAIVLDTIGGDMPPDYRPNYARDRGRRGGAAGGWS